MNTPEFSNTFDTLLNSHSKQGDFGKTNSIIDIVLDEYEKSLFLTKALLLLVVNLYNGKLTGDSFEKTEELRHYLDVLVKEELPEEIEGINKISAKSHIYPNYSDEMFRIYESIRVQGESPCTNLELEVVPILHDEYHKIKNNPFRADNKRRALRINQSGYVEIITEFSNIQYVVRYIKYPSPIILQDLPDDLEINGESKTTECELNPALHYMILELAVKMAIQSKVRGQGE